MRNRVKIRINGAGGWRTLWHAQLGQPCQPFYDITDAITWVMNNNTNSDVMELMLRDNDSKFIFKWDNYFEV